MPENAWLNMRSPILEQAVKWRTRLFGIYVEGVEVTQALQWRGAAEHLTDPADRGPDNGLPLVADKPAMVRVYVQAIRADVTGIVGTVTLQRRRWGVWTDAETPAQQAPSSITARFAPPYAAERGSRWRSLNFLIAGSLMRGRMRLKVHVERTGDPGLSADTEIEISASLRQTLRLRGIPVRYWGPDASGDQVRLAEPSLADFQAEAAWTCNAWPVSPTPDITLAGTFTWSNPLTGNINAGACPQSWNDLLFWLGIARMLDGNLTDRLYYALLPAGIPVGNAGGCGGGGAGVGAGFVGGGGGVTMAHELGHVLGFGHAPCGLATGDMGDPSYPAYEPYDTTANRRASIGEYGFDVTTGSVLSPAVATDFMSYCPTDWVSLHHHTRLVPNERLAPTWLPAPRDTLPALHEEVPVRWPPDPPEPPWVGHALDGVRPGEREGIIIVSGRLRDGEVEIRHVLRVEAVPVAAGRRVAELRAELVTRDGEVLARGAVHRLTLHASGGCGCGGSGHEGDDEPADALLQAILPDPGARGDTREAALRIVRGGEEVWRRDAPDRPPSVEDVDARLDGDDLHVRWRTEAPREEDLERFVRWSADDGRTWQLLAAGLTGDEAVVGAGALTAGEVLIQALVTDGFHTVAGEPARVAIPRRAPQVAILWPARGAAVRAGHPVRLWGMATASDGRTLDGDELSWELDGERVGPGGDLWAGLGGWEGEHVATLRAREGDLTAEASVVFEATGSGRRPYRRSGG